MFWESIKCFECHSKSAVCSTLDEWRVKSGKPNPLNIADYYPLDLGFTCSACSLMNVMSLVLELFTLKSCIVKASTVCNVEGPC